MLWTHSILWAYQSAGRVTLVYLKNNLFESQNPVKIIQEFPFISVKIVQLEVSDRFLPCVQLP